MHGGCQAATAKNVVKHAHALQKLVDGMLSLRDGCALLRRCCANYQQTDAA